MSKATRRTFLLSSAATLAGSTALGRSPARAAAPSERVRVGIIGCGNQGKSHLSAMQSLGEIEVVYVCDVDEQRLAERLTSAPGIQGVADLRRVLDDPSIDAVSIATPDHWHTPAALLALEAGKHVYVEKPCSHNLREGQMLRDAARRHGKVVVHGTQTRSSPGFREAISMIEEGVIGDVLIAKCWNWQQRRNIGHQSPSEPPAGVDYDTWVGPAPWLPFQANRFHYDWHWWRNFGCGGMGNDGIHELDYALWGLGVTTHPSRVVALGGKYFFDDDQEFPDTQQVTFEWPGDDAVGNRRMLIYEQRLWSTNYPFNVDSGAEYIGTKGRIFLSKRGKFEIRGERNAPIEASLAHSTKSDVAENQQNWIDCIKSGATPNASIDIAHRTASVVHLGNIATQLQRALQFDPDAERIIDDEAANDLLARTYRDEGHWGVPAAL